MPPGLGCMWSDSSFGASAIITSVISSRPATDAAFCSARRGPKVLITDETTTARDVTMHAQIMELPAELQRELGMAPILITHDLGVAANVADWIAVM